MSFSTSILKTFSFLLFFSFFVCPCFAHEPKRLNIVASFSILGDITKEIGGEFVDVITIVGPNGDAHVYEPTPQDAQKLAHADLVIINGLGFEGWLDRLIKASGYKGEIITATQNIQPRYDHTGCACKHGTHHLDPHAWHALENAKKYASTIQEGLSKKDPKHNSDYIKKRVTFHQKCDDLHRKTQKKMIHIPDKKRLVITTHDGFGYLGESYNICFLSPVGLSTDADPSAKKMAEIIDYVTKHNIHTVFLENITSPKLMQQIVDETNASIGPVLYSDALSDANGPAKTYLEMMAYNIDCLIQGMKDPPPPPLSSSSALTLQKID